jgi:5'-AMP-activated protein kinase beta subunit, interaction domain
MALALAMEDCADDRACCPPSDAVLHHLGTSAVTNGVFAVGVTVQYTLQ